MNTIRSVLMRTPNQPTVPICFNINLLSQKKSTNKVSIGVALRLKRICASDETFDIRSPEYQNYLIARDYSPTLVKKQFHSVRNMTRSDARQVKLKSHRLNVNLVIVYNPIIKNLETVIRNYLPILYSDPKMKNIFPEGSINITYKRGKSLRKLISPSMFTQAQAESHSIVSKCKSKRCDICQNYLVCKNEFTCTVTGKTYKVRGKLCCTSSNVIYLISCKLCKEQYVGCAFKDNFKPRFRVHKSDVITGKGRCGVVKHFLTKCTNSNKVENIEVQLIEQV